MHNKALFTLIFFTLICSFPTKAKDVDWKLLQGYEVIEKDGKPFPKISKELKIALAKKVSIKGFMIPLDYHSKHVEQFLLVPYIPACVHVPSPPANQVVLVKMKKGEKTKPSYYPIKVSGTLFVGTKKGFVDSSFRMVATKVEEIKF
ncbi:MAG: DUF3299 domain-containing protein [Bdellovibrionota bacterium]|nr:DUF3299 domain-containing protein [Bdellovibrionota bacterium]